MEFSRPESLLQGIFPTQGSNPGLLHCRQILYQLSHKTLLGILSSYTKKIEILILIQKFLQHILLQLEKCGMESCVQHTDSERREKTVYLYKQTLEGNSSTKKLFPPGFRVQIWSKQKQRRQSFHFLFFYVALILKHVNVLMFYLFIKNNFLKDSLPNLDDIIKVIHFVKSPNRQQYY